MRNIKLTIEYDGSQYAGWQIQNGRRSRTIQAAIEETLRKIIQEKIKLIGSGRTDAGVHAKAQVANFKTSSNLPLEKLQRALNGLLPEDISIIKAQEQNLNFHSRFDAKSKTYRYTVLNRSHRLALSRKFCFLYPYPLNIKLMRSQSRVLLGRHNFNSFRASNKIEKNSVRTIKSIKITRDKDKIYIDIEADGFLHNMARNIVGTLLEIGRGKPLAIQKILLARDRRQAGPTAPAKGLCLMQVKY